MLHKNENFRNLVEQKLKNVANKKMNTLTKFMKEHFKKIFVINLDRRPDRYNDFCGRIPFDYKICERFVAIDGNAMLKVRKKNPYVDACHLSHKKVLEIIVKNEENLDNDLFVIFEDDVFFSSNFESFIYKLFPSITNEISKNQLLVLYIGGRFDENFMPRKIHSWTKIADNLYIRNELFDRVTPIERDRTTNVLILTTSLAKEIMLKTSHIDTSFPIDFLYNGIKKYISTANIYEILPHITYSPKDYQTDIQKYKKV